MNYTYMALSILSGGRLKPIKCTSASFLHTAFCSMAHIIGSGHAIIHSPQPEPDLGSWNSITFINTLINIYSQCAVFVIDWYRPMRTGERDDLSCFIVAYHCLCGSNGTTSQ